MDWYKTSQTIDPKDYKIPKGWKITIKRDKGGMYLAHIWDMREPYRTAIPMTVPSAWSTIEEAKRNGIAWLNYQLSINK